MRILVCGGRDFVGKSAYAAVSRAMYYVCEMWLLAENEYRMPENVHIISGMASGADTLAIDWAVVNWQTWSEYPADWKAHGKAAGHIRNKQMLDQGKPNLVVAMPGGRGTANMIKQAEDRGVPVWRFDESGHLLYPDEGGGDPREAQGVVEDPEASSYGPSLEVLSLWREAWAALGD